MEYLVATDGSDESDVAVELAAEDASVREVSLVIVHVLKPQPELIGGELVLPGGERAVELGEEIVEAATDLAEGTAAEHDADLEIDTELLGGYPAEAITSHAIERDVDRIYVGHRGESPDRDRTVGSVAKTVIDKASLPVTIVR